MIFNEELVFIHVGKTGGMSCADYLLHNLKPPIYNCHAGADEESLTIPNQDIIAVTTIDRHCTLKAASAHILRLTNRPVEDRKIVAVIRNPYELEYSFYRHLKKPGVAKRRKTREPGLVELAQGNFTEFARSAGYHRRKLRQEDFFLIDGNIPANVDVIRYEDLEQSFVNAVAPYCRDIQASPFPHTNKSEQGELESLLDEELKRIIYRKHPYIFDNFYPALRPSVVKEIREPGGVSDTRF